MVDVTHMPGDHGPPELATAEAVAAGLTDSHKHEHKTTIDAAYFEIHAFLESGVHKGWHVSASS